MVKTIAMVLVIAGLSGIATAQDTATIDYQHHIKLNLAPLVAARSLSLFYERPYKKSTSISLGVNYWNDGKDSPLFEPGTLDHYRMLALTAGLRIYASDESKSIRGFYMAPYIRWRYINLDRTVYNAPIRIYSIGPGFSLGHQFLIGRAKVDLFVGSTLYFWNSQNLYDSNFEWLYNDLRAGVCIGYSWGRG